VARLEKQHYFIGGGQKKKKSGGELKKKRKDCRRCWEGHYYKNTTKTHRKELQGQGKTGGGVKHAEGLGDGGQKPESCSTEYVCRKFTRLNNTGRGIICAVGRSGKG